LIEQIAELEELRAIRGGDLTIPWRDKTTILIIAKISTMKRIKPILGLHESQGREVFAAANGANPQCASEASRLPNVLQLVKNGKPFLIDFEQFPPDTKPLPWAIEHHRAKERCRDV
jgi:hypothetical protein